MKWSSCGKKQFVIPDHHQYKEAAKKLAGVGDLLKTKGARQFHGGFRCRVRRAPQFARPRAEYLPSTSLA